MISDDTIIRLVTSLGTYRMSDAYCRAVASMSEFGPPVSADEHTCPRDRGGRVRTPTRPTQRS